MPYYVVKVADKAGWIMPPILARAHDEDEAIEFVQKMFPDGYRIEAKGQRPDVVKAAFGHVPQGAVMIRHDWVWRGESDDTPEPY